uniref:NAD(P)(+) transhydrogenase (Si-specific) n=1 Tax=Heterosigma akashiwo TaxID=2829 RepID=A0A7S3XPN0_HETAK
MGGSMGKINSGGLSFEDILARVHKVILGELATLGDKGRAHNIRVYAGTASFLDQNTVMVKREHTNPSGGAVRTVDEAGADLVLTSDKFLISTGTRPVHPASVQFDGECVLDSDDMLAGNLKHMPRHFIVIGGGVIGMEYASMINIVPGCSATVIDGRGEVLPFMDRELTQTLRKIMRDDGARFLMGETVAAVARRGDQVVVALDSGKKVVGDAVLYAVGRRTTVEELNLPSGVKLTSRGLIEVDKNYQTGTPNIYAAGDVIGFPALASTAMEQGRYASGHMWGDPVDARLSGFPYGIYTVPEMGMIGKTEQQLTEEGVDYEVGVARLEECAKGQMLGGSAGLLKLLFRPDDLAGGRPLLGVHALGENATEIVHIGQVAMDMGQGLDYFTQAVFNYPTFAEAYRAAAFDGLRRATAARAAAAAATSA